MKKIYLILVFVVVSTASSFSQMSAVYFDNQVGQDFDADGSYVTPTDTWFTTAYAYTFNEKLPFIHPQSSGYLDNFDVTCNGCTSVNFDYGLDDAQIIYNEDQNACPSTEAMIYYDAGLDVVTITCN